MAMLLFLQTLHIFWFSNIVQMGYNFVVKKQLGDTIDGFKSKGVEDEKPKSS